MHIQYIDIKRDKNHYILMRKVVEILISFGGLRGGDLNNSSKDNREICNRLC